MQKLTKIIELGSEVEDSATGSEGVVTHLEYNMDGSYTYVFQPKGLSPKTKEPLDPIWLVANRLRALNSDDVIDAPELPYELLGTQVKDKASGYNGMAVSIVLHINGCVHVNVQAKGAAENGSPIRACNFDIRRLEGEVIKPMTKPEKRESQRQKPSPAGLPEKQRFL